MQSDALGIMMHLTQSYDNAATLAGIYGGAQTIMICNGCVHNSFNLWGQHSLAENVSSMTFFFEHLKTMFYFSAASIHWWDILILECQSESYQQHAGVLIMLQLSQWHKILFGKC